MKFLTQHEGRRKATNRLLMILIMVFFFSTLTGGVERYTKWQDEKSHYSEWFVYESVEPVKWNFKIGENVQFNSTSEIKKTVDMRWNDIMYCNSPDDPSDFDFFSSYTTDKDNAKPKPMGTGDWTYSAPTPQVPTSCYLKSTITATTKLGNEKVQVLEDPMLIFNFIY